MSLLIREGRLDRPFSAPLWKSGRCLPGKLASVLLLAFLLCLTLSTVVLSQEGYEDDGYERINAVDPIDRIHEALQRWGRLFQGIALALLIVIGLKIIGPVRRYETFRQWSLKKAVRDVNDLLKRIQAEAEAASEAPPPPAPVEEGLLAGMAEVAEFAEAEPVPSYVLTVNDFMLDNMRIAMKKLRRRSEGNAERYKDYLFSVLQGIKMITEQSAEAGVNSGLAVDVKRYFGDHACYRAWTKVLHRFSRHGEHREAADAFLLFMKEIRKGRPLSGAVRRSDTEEDTAIAVALPSSGAPRALNEETLPAIQEAAGKEAVSLCDLVHKSGSADTTCAWQFDLVREQPHVRSRDETQRMLSVFLSTERKALLEITGTRMLPCRAWDHVLYMLGAETAEQLHARVAEKRFVIQEIIILEKAFLQTFAKRESLGYVYGHGPDADLMIDMHVPEIRRESLRLLRKLHKMEPKSLDEATDALNEEETRERNEVRKLIRHYVHHRHPLPIRETGPAKDGESRHRPQT